MASGRNLYITDVWVCMLMFTHLHIMHFANIILSLQTKLSPCQITVHQNQTFLIEDINGLYTTPT